MTATVAAPADPDTELDLDLELEVPCHVGYPQEDGTRVRCEELADYQLRASCSACGTRTAFVCDYHGCFGEIEFMQRMNYNCLRCRGQNRVTVIAMWPIR